MLDTNIASSLKMLIQEHFFLWYSKTYVNVSLCRPKLGPLNVWNCGGLCCVGQSNSTAFTHCFHMFTSCLLCVTLMFTTSNIFVCAVFHNH